MNLRDELGPDDYARKRRAIRDYCATAQGQRGPLCTGQRVRLMGRLWFGQRRARAS